MKGARGAGYLHNPGGRGMAWSVIVACSDYAAAPTSFCEGHHSDINKKPVGPGFWNGFQGILQLPLRQLPY